MKISGNESGLPMVEHSGGMISDFKMSSDTEAGANMDRGKNGVIPAEIGVVPVRRHSGIGQQTRGKHQRVLQMGVVGGTIYGLKRRLPVEEVRIGDQAGGKNGLHNQLPIQQGVFRLLLQDHQQNGLELTRVGIGNQAGGKNGQHHQLRIQQGVFRLLLHAHQQNGLEVTRVGSGDQAGGKNGLHLQLPIQQGVCLILRDTQQNGLEVTRVGIGDQAAGKNGLRHQLPIQQGVFSLILREIGIGKQAVGKQCPAPVANSGGSFPPPHSQPSAEESRSYGDWNWEESSWQTVPAPVANSGGSFPPPHSQPSAEEFGSHGDWNRQASSGQTVPAPVATSEAEDLENWGSKWKPISPESGENTARHNSNCEGVQNLMVIIDKVIQRANRDQKLSAADLIGIFGQHVMVKNPSHVLPGTVIRLTGNVGHSSQLVGFLAKTLRLPPVKVSGRYQKWVRDEGDLQLCHWSLNACENDGHIMHQSFHSVFTQWRRISIFILSGEQLHDVKGFEQFINCSVHFIPSPDEECTKCSIAVSSEISLRDQAVWILLYVLCRNLFPAYEIGKALSHKACQSNTIHNLYIK